MFIKKEHIIDANSVFNFEIIDFFNQSVNKISKNDKKTLDISLKYINDNSDKGYGYILFNSKTKKYDLLLGYETKNFNNNIVKGIIAHELAHVYNKDTEFKFLYDMIYYRISTIEIVALIFLIINYIMNANLYLIPIILFNFLAIIFTAFVYSNIQQKKEFLADFNAVKLSSKEIMIQTLEQLKSIEKPRKKIFTLFSSHPCILKRIKRIEELK